jgi:hypothetical protein
MDSSEAVELSVVAQSMLKSVALETIEKPTLAQSRWSDWIPPTPHTHVALDDAKEQGQIFCKMLAIRREALLNNNSFVKAT